MRAKLELLLEKHKQSHLLKFWGDLTAEQQGQLATQINQIDFDLVETLLKEESSENSWGDLASRAVVPPAITLDDFANEESYNAARATGRTALAAGELGMVLVAGGQGSRLGFDHPKGMYPIGPVSDATLYQIHFEKVMARAEQFGAPVPMYVMTSPPTHAETSEFLKQHQFFGMNPDHVRIFCQGTMPAVDDRGKLLLADRHVVFESPNGHGGTLAGLVDSGCLDHARSLGVKHLFYGQVDNPLVQICDPALVGYHINSGSEMTSQVVRKSDPLQKVGNVVDVDGRVQIIEYSDLPDENARELDESGNLKIWAGSIAVHVFSVGFLQQCSSQAETLPYHRARKKVPFVDDAGDLVKPEKPNATKFERFIFDLLPFAKNSIVCEVDAADGFCALKNAPPAPAETEAHVRQAISDLHCRWLAAASVDVADGVKVEISPLYAVDAEAVKEKFDAGSEVDQDTYFSDAD